MGRYKIAGTFNWGEGIWNQVGRDIKGALTLFCKICNILLMESSQKMEVVTIK